MAASFSTPIPISKSKCPSDNDTLTPTPPPTILALLIDISGTLLIGKKTPTPGAIHALFKLRHAGIPFRCCSNTSQQSTEEVYRTMVEVGLDVRRDEVFTSVGAVRGVVEEMGVRRPYMLLSKSAAEECAGTCVASSRARATLHRVHYEHRDHKHHPPILSTHSPTFSIVSTSDPPPTPHLPVPITNPDSEVDLPTGSEYPDTEVCRDSYMDTGTNMESRSLSPSPSPRDNDTENDNDNDNDNDNEYDAVVIGLAPDLFTYENLNTAFRILVGEYEYGVMRGCGREHGRGRSSSPSSSGDHINAKTKAKPKPPLIALHKALYIQSSDNALSLGPGPFVMALEAATGVKARVVGKPTKLFFESVMRDMGVLEREQKGGLIAVIGDDVKADLGEGAVELGLWRVLVKTGKYRPGDESRVCLDEDGHQTPLPDQVCDSFADFVDWLLLGAV